MIDPIDPVDVFVHIPKTGGSTIRTVLSRAYGIDKIYGISSSFPDELEYQQKIIAGIKDKRIRLLPGHYPFGVHEILKIPCRYFTMVRNPVERVISDYYFAFKADYHAYHQEICKGNITLERYLLDPELKVGVELQSFLLLGEEYKSKLAEEYLQKQYAFVGVAEKFEESMLLFAKYFRWQVPLYLKRNVSSHKESSFYDRSLVFQKNYKALKARYRVDFECYHQCVELLNKTMLGEGKHFLEALDAFLEIQQYMQIRCRENSQVYSEYVFEKEDELPAFMKSIGSSEPYRVIEEYLNSEIKFKIPVF